MIKSIIYKALIILVPTYIIAYTTEKMVYVIPMLAVCALVAATYDEKIKRRLDEDSTDYGSRKDDGLDG
tara:strand:- start:47 stop:253 length:207 start_codon:yes stop_codon:yes gene_type:complete